MGDTQPAPAAIQDQIYAKDDEGAKGAVQYDASLSEKTSVDIRGFLEKDKLSEFMKQIPESNGKHRFLIGKFTKKLPSVIKVLVPLETYNMTEAFDIEKRLNKNLKIKLGPPLNYKKRTNLKVSKELIPELTNLGDETERQSVIDYFRELQHEGEFLQDILAFEKNYLGWITEKDTKYKTSEQQRIVRSAMKALFQFIFSDAKINDANSYYQHITIGYTKLNPDQKLPCNTDIRADFIKCLEYRREVLVSEILTQAKGITMLDLNTPKEMFLSKLSESGVQNIYVQKHLDFLHTLDDFLVYVNKKKEEFCMVYGDVAEMKEFVSDKAVKQGLKQGVTDMQAEILIRLFRNFVQAPEEDRENTYSYSKLTEMMKDMSKIPDDGEKANSHIIYKELIEHLQLMIGSNAQTYLDDMERHIILLQELLQFTVRLINKRGGLDENSSKTPVSDDKIDTILEEIQKKFPENSDLQGIQTILKGIQRGDYVQKNSALKPVVDEYTKIIKGLEDQLATIQSESKVLGTQNEGLQKEIDRITTEMIKLEGIVKAVHEELGIVKEENNQLKAEIQKLKETHAAEIAKAEEKQKEELERLQKEQKESLVAKESEYSSAKTALESQIEEEKAKTIRLQTSLDEESSKITGLQTELDVLRSSETEEKTVAAASAGELETAKARIAALEQQLAELIAKHSLELAQVKEQNEAAIASLQEEHTTAIAVLQANHAVAIEQLKDTLAEKHAEELADQKDTLEQESSGEFLKKDKKIKELLEQIDKLQKELDSKLSIVPALQASQEEKIQLLKERTDVEEELTRVKSLLAQKERNVMERQKTMEELATSYDVEAGQTRKQFEERERQEIEEKVRAKARVAELEAELATLKSGATASTTQLADLQGELASARATAEQKDRNIQSIREEIAKAQEDFTASTSSSANKIRAKELEAEAAKSEQKRLQDELADIRTQLLLLQQEQGRKEAIVQKSQSNIQSLTQQLQEAPQQVRAELQKELDAEKAKAAIAEKERAKAVAQYAVKEAAVQRLTTELAEAQRSDEEVEALRSQIKRMEDELAKKPTGVNPAELYALRAELTAKDANIEKRGRLLGTAYSDIDGLKAQIAELQKQLAGQLLPGSIPEAKTEKVTEAIPAVAPSAKRRGSFSMKDLEKASAAAKEEKPPASKEAWSETKAPIGSTGKGLVFGSSPQSDEVQSKSGVATPPKTPPPITSITDEQIPLYVNTLYTVEGSIESFKNLDARSQAKIKENIDSLYNIFKKNIIDPVLENIKSIRKTAVRQVEELLDEYFNPFNVNYHGYEYVDKKTGYTHKIKGKGLYLKPTFEKIYKSILKDLGPVSGINLFIETANNIAYNITDALLNPKEYEFVTEKTPTKTLPMKWKYFPPKSQFNPQVLVSPAQRVPMEAWKGGGKQTIAKQDLCESFLTALLFKADKIAESENPELEVQTLVDKAGATLDDLGQCPLVLDLLIRLLQETPKNISPLHRLKQGLTFHTTNMDQQTQSQLDELDKAYNTRFTKDEQKVLSRLSPRVTLYSRSPEAYQELLGDRPYMIEEHDMEYDEENDEIPLHGLDDDIVLTEEEQEALENTGYGGIPLGALMFLYTLCLKEVLQHEEHPTLNSKCRLLNPQRTVERSKTPKARNQTPKSTRRKKATKKVKS
jgi:hypothetical protein